MSLRRLGFRPVLANEIERVYGRHGSAIEIALPLVAAFLLQSGGPRRLLHALGRYGQSKSAAKAEEGAHQRVGLGLVLHALDEAAVDLDLVDLEVAQMIKARIAGAEIVERDAHPGAGQRHERFPGAFKIMHDRRLGEFDLEAARREAGLSQDTEDPQPQGALL